MSKLHEIASKWFIECQRKRYAHKGDYDCLISDFIEAVKKKLVEDLNSHGREFSLGDSLDKMKETK